MKFTVKELCVGQPDSVRQSFGELLKDYYLQYQINNPELAMPPIERVEEGMMKVNSYPNAFRENAEQLLNWFTGTTIHRSVRPPGNKLENLEIITTDRNFPH